MRNKKLEDFLQLLIDNTSEDNLPIVKEVIQSHLEKYTQIQNAIPEAAFEGYSTEEMHLVIQYLWKNNCPVQLRDLQEDDFEQIPILRQMRLLLKIVTNAGKIKLTKSGFLPPSIVHTLYDTGIPDADIKKGVIKLRKERDTISVQIAHQLLRLVGAIKVQKGVMTLTQKGKKLINKPQELLQLSLLKYCMECNWAYFDNFSNTHIGKIGVGFSIILLSMYGDEVRSEDFYAHKYFRAFPEMRPSSEEEDEMVDYMADICYCHRTMDRFLLQFGLITVDCPEGQDDTFITRTPLFERMISVYAPLANA